MTDTPLTPGQKAAATKRLNASGRVCENCGKAVVRFESDAVIWQHITGSWIHVETRLFACRGVYGNDMASVASCATLALSE